MLLQCLIGLTSCLATVQETSISGENGFHGDASTLDGISTFQVGQRREAPPPSLMSQVLLMPLVQVPFGCRGSFSCIILDQCIMLLSAFRSCTDYDE